MAEHDHPTGDDPPTASGQTTHDGPAASPGRASHDEERIPSDASLTAVEAHGMLNSLAIVRGVLSVLRKHGSTLDEAMWADLLDRADSQLEFLADSLGDLARGIPSDARDYLEQLRSI